jgi:hypothetical protein
MHMTTRLKMTRTQMRRITSTAATAVLGTVAFVEPTLGASPRGPRTTMATASYTEQVKPETSAPRAVEIELRRPETPSVGDNRFEVIVRDALGEPVAGADVSVALYKRPTFGPKGQIQNAFVTKVRLSPGVQVGTYEGTGILHAEGHWDMRIQVKRQDVKVGSKETRLLVHTRGGGQARF